jgi:hypothetical protein
MYKSVKFLMVWITVLSLLAVMAGCGIELKYADAAAAPSGETAMPSPSPSAAVHENTDNSPSPQISEIPSAAPSPSPSASPTPVSPPVKLVEYKGTVEHLFFHPVIAYPELAFDGDNKEKGLDSYMVTVDEYLRMLESLYAKNYILVDMNDVWTFTDEGGAPRMKRASLMVPEGKKPLILSYDDTNYYNYMIANGFTYKLVIKDGELWSYGLDPQGKPVYSQDLDAITILDKFVRQHPDFSLNGAKGCLCLTGYEGILGYRTMTDTKGMTPEAEAARQEEIKAVKPIVAMLKETGWYFGSHSWGHITLSDTGLESVKTDTQRWLMEVGALVGPTKLYFYPFGARPDGDDVRQTGEVFKYLQGKGFRVFASVGMESFSKPKSDICAVICDRMHADGDTLRGQRDRYLKFYDAKLVFDYENRPDFGTKW